MILNPRSLIFCNRNAAAFNVPALDAALGKRKYIRPRFAHSGLLAIVGFVIVPSVLTMK